MRRIGNVDSKATAKVLGWYLASRSIAARVEEEQDKSWSVWVMFDDDLPRAREEFDAFQANPADPRFAEGAREAEKAGSVEAKAGTRTRHKVIDARMAISRANVMRHGPVTYSLVALSILAYLVATLTAGENALIVFVREGCGELGPLFISETNQGFLTEVLHGQVWRLFTPMFLHFGLLHIVFNMLWLRDLGGLVEHRHGSKYLLVFVLAASFASNLLQYFIAGPSFGGMSGVVYGLLGYVWLRGRLDFNVGYRLNQSTVTMMLVWFVLCWTGALGPIANWAHAGGLAIGALVGWAEAKFRPTR